MSSEIKVYHLQVPEGQDAEALSDLFGWIDTEGIEILEHEIKIYVNQDQEEDLISFITNIAEEQPLKYKTEKLEKKNWNETWEKSFQPVKIRNFVGVRASFHSAFPDVEHDIIINPKMSFGTGHHATTHQVMEHMEKAGVLGKKVLDCGSGTGILSILAYKMGAKQVVAVDNDSWCYENHRENNALNQADTRVILGQLEDIAIFDFDLVLANIQKNYLLENMEKLAERMLPGGDLIISGFHTPDNQDLLEKAQQHQLIAKYVSEIDNWSCILLSKAIKHE